MNRSPPPIQKERYEDKIFQSGFEEFITLVRYKARIYNRGLIMIAVGAGKIYAIDLISV